MSLTKEGGYIHLDQINWPPERLQHGVLVKLKAVPFPVRLFKRVATNGDIDWVITSGPDQTVTAPVARDANDVRGQVEELHRGLKQLTGSAKCQCRKARSQRNHLAGCYHAGLSRKVKAKHSNRTLYQVKADLLRDYLRVSYVTHESRPFSRPERKSCLESLSPSPFAHSPTRFSSTISGRKLSNCKYQVAASSSACCGIMPMSSLDSIPTPSHAASRRIISTAT